MLNTKKAQKLYDLALQLERSIEKERDSDKKDTLRVGAQRAYEQAAALEHIEATHNLATIHQISGNLPEAIRHYEISAAAGWDSSRANLGTIYLGVFGVEYKNDRALELLETAAAQGNRTATENLLKYYNGGFGVHSRPDEAQATKYEEKLSQLSGDDALKYFKAPTPNLSPKPTESTSSSSSNPSISK